MSDHLALYADKLVTSSASLNCIEIPSSCCPALPPCLPQDALASSEEQIAKDDCQIDINLCNDEVTERDIEDSGSLAECRICQEEDEVGNLESPCACSGSLKFAHRKCVQHWCNEKGDTLCEICRQPYESGYTAPPQPSHGEHIPIITGANWGIAGGQRVHEPRLFAVSAEHHFLDADYAGYAGANASSAACFRSAALMLMVLLLLRHILSMTAAGADEDTSTYFMLFLLRTAGFLLPCYIMVRAMNVLLRRRQRQEVAMAAAEVAYLLQTGHAEGVRFALSPGRISA